MPQKTAIFIGHARTGNLTKYALYSIKPLTIFVHILKKINLIINISPGYETDKENIKIEQCEFNASGCYMKV
jgi:hypothetical protein